jgi:putative endonuclease
MKKVLKKYSVYILRCVDTTLYTGITNDLDKRLHAHNALKSGAKYTKTRRPVTLVHSTSFKTKGEALKKEYAIKQMTRLEKQKLINEV